MALSRVTPTQDSAWSSLVSRSITAWNELTPDELPFSKYLHEDLLSEYHSLDEFLAESPHSATFWFFQSRDAFMSQNHFRKWSREVLDDYVLLPAMPDYRQNPDPDGQTLRLHQAQIGPQEWLYIWVDWTCLPQHPRSGPEETYFSHGLRTMSGVIRNTGFSLTPDIELFLQHIDEMIEKGVQKTLEKHRYRCYEDRDRQYEGSLVYLGNKHTFTPFPKWDIETNT
ncbi:hypothetical protein J3E71DRAFT_390004 [Bipolaris maydis]|nr:hypothetical protein J3E71DRAFT_390004 [Bipolaris maydis]